MSTIVCPIEKLVIDGSEIYLEEFGESKGKIVITKTYHKNYSYQWGAMGRTLKEFLCEINGSYFANCLIAPNKDYVINWKKTFTEIRKSIRTDLSLPWYKHIEFQKQMREVLNDFEKYCAEVNSAEFFVEAFKSNFIKRLDFTLVDTKSYSLEAERLEKDFESISEVWYYIVRTEGPEYLWLVNMHKKLKQVLQKAL